MVPELKGGGLGSGLISSPPIFAHLAVSLNSWVDEEEVVAGHMLFFGGWWWWNLHVTSYTIMAQTRPRGWK